MLYTLTSAMCMSSVLERLMIPEKSYLYCHAKY
jgi:hypothetical protein